MIDLSVPTEVARQGILRVLKAGAPGISEEMREGLTATMMRFVRPALQEAGQNGMHEAARICDEVRGLWGAEIGSSAAEAADRIRREAREES